jgi:hypothetical protein
MTLRTTLVNIMDGAWKVWQRVGVLEHTAAMLRITSKCGGPKGLEL